MNRKSSKGTSNSNVYETTWQSQIQIRQKVSHRKTCYYLEQLMLKHRLDKKVLAIESVDNGFNIFYSSLQEAKHMIGYLVESLPNRVKQSTETFTQDHQNNITHIRNTFLVDIPAICKNDLVLLPIKLATKFGGVGRIQICYRVYTTIIHLLDPMSFKCTELNADDYFLYENEFRILELKRDGSEYLVVDIEKEEASRVVGQQFVDKLVTVSIMNELDYEVVQVRTQLGDVLKVGQTVIGYDLNKINQEIEELDKRPEIVIAAVKDDKPQKRVGLLRMDIQSKRKTKEYDEDFDEFVREAIKDKDVKGVLNVQETSDDEEMDEPYNQWD